MVKDYYKTLIKNRSKTILKKKKKTLIMAKKTHLKVRMVPEGKPDSAFVLLLCLKTNKRRKSKSKIEN